MKYAAQAQYRNFGYDHIVRLTNTCPARATCRVSTDVNPTAVTVELSAGEVLDVLTFRGSPSRIFTPAVACEAPSR